MIVYYFIKKENVKEEKKIIEDSKNDIEKAHNVIEKEKYVKILGYCVCFLTAITIISIISPVIVLIIFALTLNGD